MDLNTLIPNSKDERWSVKGKYLRYMKYTNIPVAYISDDGVVFIFLDLRIIRPISKLIPYLVKMDVKFYFEPPDMSNPGVDMSDYHKRVIKHYLYSYADKHMYASLKKIDYDLVKNMVSFCDEYNCHEYLKESFEEIKRIVMRTDIDWYTNRTTFDYPDEIRSNFENLYRDIQISKII